MSKINTAPVSGMRDYLPTEIAKRQWVFKTVESVFRSYGFQPLETPIIERLDILSGHYGDDEKLIFKVLKRGDKLQAALKKPQANEADLADGGLRYDLTVPLARVVAQYANELPRIFKRFHMAPVFRAERPAAGRYREFYQCDIDVVGSNSLLCEAELLSAAILALNKLGLKDSKDLRLKLNHRALLTAMMETAGLGVDQYLPAMISIDKLDKIAQDGVDLELAERGITIEAREKLWDLLANLKSEDHFADKLSQLKEKIVASPNKDRAFQDLERLWSLLKDGPIAAHLDFDPSLARGLGYYTGCIFELHIGAFASSCGGGGRYDKLIGQFLGEDVTATGISLGIERILLILEERALFPAELSAFAQVMIANFDHDGETALLKLASQIRDLGISCEVFPETQKIGKQFKYAEKHGIPLVILAGPDERAKGLWMLKNLASGEQTALNEGELLQHLKHAIPREQT